MKAPAMQFYVKDFVADTVGLSAEARGCWISILCDLHLARRRGQATRTAGEWARIMGVTEEQAEPLLEQIRQYGCATISRMSQKVTDGHKEITVVSRRMVRERKLKENNTFRQRKHRASQRHNEKVTPPSATASATALKTPLPPSLDTPDFQKAWSDWEAYRLEIRHGLKPSTRQRQFALLSKHSPEQAIAMIEQSITAGWQGLFEVNNGNRTRQGGPGGKQGAGRIIPAKGRIIKEPIRVDA